MHEFTPTLLSKPVRGPYTTWGVKTSMQAGKFIVSLVQTDSY